jgi:hypothetical protein
VQVKFTKESKISVSIVNEENGYSLEGERYLVLAEKCKVTLTVKLQYA